MKLADFPLPLLLGLALTAAPLPAAAQTADSGPTGDGETLRLFEPVEEEPAGFANRPGDISMPASGSTGEPRFQLVGTSRFGDRYRARLKTRDGQVVAVDVPAGATVDVPGHPGFTIAVPESRRVLVNHPGSVPCVADPEQGVECREGGNQSRLQLATATPLQSREPSAAGGDESAESGEQQEQAGSGEPENPFARALRAARERSARGENADPDRARRFQQVRRIPPEEVPEGYRVVRTPLGDRLIQE